MQYHFATLTHDKQTKRVQYLVKLESALLSQKDDCHHILADFGNNQISYRINDTEENIIFKLLDSFSFQAVKPFQYQYKKPNKKKTKILMQQSANLIDVDITDTDDPIGIKVAQNEDPLLLDLSLIKNPSTSETYYDSAYEILLLQKIHETFSSVNKHSLNNSLFGPSFFKYTSEAKKKFAS